MEWISKILGNAVSSRIIFVACVVSGSMLFMPSNWVAKLRLDAFFTDYGKFIGITFLASLGLLIINTGGWILNKFIQWRKKAKEEAERQGREVEQQAAVIQSLQNLDDSEKAIMREFGIQRKNTIQLPIDHHVVAGLLKKRLITIVGTNGKASLAGVLCPVNISSYAEPYITEELLGFPKVNGKPTEEQIYEVMSKRPRFIDTIERHNWMWNG